MRYRELFTVFPRKLKSGRTVYYYQTYDEEGNRTAGRSTSAVRARDARMYCMKLYKAGLLGVTEKKTPTMAEFSTGWWDMKTCEYVRSRMTRRKISKSYVRIARSVLERDILPAFGNKRINSITSSDVDKWVVAKTKVEIMTAVEVRRLFDPRDATGLWKDEMHRTLNMLAATTGVRIGEIQGLKGSCLRGEYYLEVSGQYNAFHEYTDTKTHDLPPSIPDPPAQWSQVYQRMAQQDELEWQTLDDLMDAVRAFLGPIVSREHVDRWSPEEWKWHDARSESG